MSTPPDPSDQSPVQDGSIATSRAKKIFCALAAAVIVLAGILVFTLASHAAAKDYISYWSAGRLLIHHADPYSPAGVLAMEKAQGFSATLPIIVRNPPWALFLVVPLGFGGVFAGLFLWTVAAVGCVLIFAQLLDVPPKDCAFGFVFAPALAAIYAGQSSPFLLLGFSLFLRFHRTRPFLAGAALLLMAIKPHLFLIFWAVLLVDCIYRRRFLILAGGASALAAATAFSMCLDVHIWQHYLLMLRASMLSHEFFPTASMLLRLLIYPRAGWLLFVPSALAVLWGLWYYVRWRHVWNWRVHGMLLMLVTVMVSPYAWFSDEIVLLPSIVFALAFQENRKYSAWILMAINSVALLIVIAGHAALSSRAYLWTPLAWLAWFLYATYKPARENKHLPLQLAETAELEKAQEV